MFFNKEGILNIDESVVNNESFKKIMEDKIVTEEEIREQSEKVVKKLHEIENKYTKEQADEIKDLLVQAGVLYSIYNYYSIQNLNK